jgi:hypothetical protein
MFIFPNCHTDMLGTVQPWESRACEVLTIFILTFGWRTTWRDFDSFDGGVKMARVQSWDGVRNCDHGCR